MKRTKTQNGITLVALIITIVVLLILAVVSINAIQNEGIMSQAQQSAEKFNQSQKEEQETLNSYEQWFDIYGGDSATTYTAYSIGDEVTIGTESFYVIKDSGTAESTVVLLAKECISTTTKKQTASANVVAFSDANYWTENATASYPYNFRDGEPFASEYAAYAAYQYGDSLDGKGRLLTYEEVGNLLNKNKSNIVYGTTSANGYLDYWLGTIIEEFYVYAVYGESPDYGDEYYTNSHSVRPVVTISKTKLAQ